MKRISQRLIGDPAGIADRYEVAAQFLEDLAMHADSDKERQCCFAAARNFRLGGQNKPANRKRPKGEMEPKPMQPEIVIWRAA